MYVVRSITAKDAEDFVAMAFDASIGMTSMPKNKEVLHQKVESAVDSFRRDIQTPGSELYLFVLENSENGEIIGTCGIAAKTGLSNPIYFYRIETHYKNPSFIPSPQKIPIMRVVQYKDAPTEICSLFLSHKNRSAGFGKLLSLSRFLFIAAHTQRFEKIVYAEMRGFVDQHNFCPFWEGIGKHFVDIDFVELMHIRDIETIDVAQALPMYPIYLHLLSKEVQDSLGKVHPSTIPALQMLIREGFSLTEEIDVFDGGPKIEAETKEINTVKNSIVGKVEEIVYKMPESNRSLISNEGLTDFRACLGSVQTNQHGGLILDAESAKALKIEVGNSIRYI